MSTTFTLVFMAIGVAFALTGIMLFAYFRARVLDEEAKAVSKRGAKRPREAERNVLRFAGVGIEVSAPSLIIFLVGCGLFIFPFTPYAGRGPDQGFFQEELSEVVTATGLSSYDSYVTITDDTESIQLDVPTAWSDYRTDALVDDGEPVAPLIEAAPDLAALYSGFSEPGVFFTATTSLGGLVDEDLLLDEFAQSPDCVYDDRFDYDDGLYTGKYDLWFNCDGTDTEVAVVAAVPEDRSFIAVVAVQVVSEADLEALDTILATFEVLENFDVVWGEEALPPFSPGEGLGDVLSAVIGPSSYDSYVTIRDDTDTLALDTPSVWSDIDTMSMEFESGLVAPAILAAPDLDGYAGAYWGPGVFFFATTEFSDVNSMLDSLDESAACVYEGRFDYVNPFYTGKYDLWSNCEGIGTSIVTVAVTPEDRSFIAVIVVQMVSEADLEALDTIVDTFVVLD